MMRFWVRMELKHYSMLMLQWRTEPYASRAKIFILKPFNGDSLNFRNGGHVASLTGGGVGRDI